MSNAKDFGLPDTPISKPIKKKKRSEVKSGTCECYVKVEGMFDDLSLFTDKCEFHQTVFDVIMVLSKQDAERLWEMQNAWRDHIWNTGFAMKYIVEDDDAE